MFYDLIERIERTSTRYFFSAWAIFMAGVYVEISRVVDDDAGRSIEFPAFVNSITTAPLIALGLLSVAATLLCCLSALLIYRRSGKIQKMIVNAVAFFFAFSVWSPLSAPFLDSVCGKRAGCFYLSIASVPTDTVFEIWTAPDPHSSKLTRVETGVEFNYSEDGSYTSNARLILSGNERVLVLSRGGYLVDAINLSDGRLLSSFISWSRPDRDRAMQANSDNIQQILDTNS